MGSYVDEDILITQGKDKKASTKINKQNSMTLEIKPCMGKFRSVVCILSKCVWYHPIGFMVYSSIHAVHKMVHNAALEIQSSRVNTI